MARDVNSTHCRRLNNRDDSCRFLNSDICDYVSVSFRLFLLYRNNLLFDGDDLGEGGRAEVRGQSVAEV